VRALVTGCAGFIGFHLAQSLLSDGASVVGIDCFNDNYGRPQKLDNVRELMEWGELHPLTEDCELVFHLAAEPGVRSSWGDRFELYTRNNVLATQHLLDAVRMTPGKRFVYASSSSVYGDAEALPTPETAVPAPISPYGMSKLGGEHLCHMYATNFGVHTVALRYFTVYGPRQRPDMAFNIFCRAALEGEPLRVFGDGTQVRDFTFVEDVVAATRAASGDGVPADTVYNIGGGNPTSLREVLGLIGEFAGRQLEIEYTSREHGDVKRTAADTTRARSELGFSPTVELRDGLHAEFEWMSSALTAR
jgi:nucleoside-diphosphate-sugar epimerase